MRPANEPCDSAEFSRKIRRTENRALSFPVINYKHTRILLQIANTHTPERGYVRFNRGFSAAILRNGPSSRVHCAPGFRSSESRFARPNSNFCLGLYVEFRFECVCMYFSGLGFWFFWFCALEIGWFECGVEECVCALALMRLKMEKIELVKLTLMFKLN